MSSFDRGAVRYALTSELTSWDDALIKKNVVSREQCLIAKGFTTEQVVDILAKERAERAREADAQAEDLRAQVAATRALLDEANAKSEALETRATEADALVAELGRQLEASAEALEATSEEAAAAAAKAAEEKASALLEKEFEALTRCEEAAAKAKAEAEAEAEAERDRLKQEWTKRLSDQVADAADQLARATETFETERAERDASIARMEAEAEESAGEPGLEGASGRESTKARTSARVYADKSHLSSFGSRNSRTETRRRWSLTRHAVKTRRKTRASTESPGTHASTSMTVSTICITNPSGPPS